MDKISKIDLNISDLRLEIIKRIFDLLDFSKEVRTVNIDDSSTSTSELSVRLEPSDRLRRIFSAILAGDVDALTVEHDGLLAR